MWHVSVSTFQSAFTALEDMFRFLIYVLNVAASTVIFFQCQCATTTTFFVISEVIFVFVLQYWQYCEYDTSVHTLTSATYQIESNRAGIWCEETSQEETNKQTCCGVDDKNRVGSCRWWGRCTMHALHYLFRNVLHRKLPCRSRLHFTLETSTLTYVQPLKTVAPNLASPHATAVRQTLSVLSVETLQLSDRQFRSLLSAR